MKVRDDQNWTCIIILAIKLNFCNIVLCNFDTVIISENDRRDDLPSDIEENNSDKANIYKEDNESSYMPMKN